MHFPADRRGSACWGARQRQEFNEIDSDATWAAHAPRLLIHSGRYELMPRAAFLLGAYLHSVLKLSWFTVTVPSALIVMCAVS